MSGEIQTVQSTSAPTPAALIEVALASKASPETLERLLALQMKWEGEQARKAYAEAMINLKGENLTISHDREVKYPGTAYSHASLGKVCDILTKAAARHGFSHSWKTDQSGGMVGVTCTLTHRGGHFETERMEAPPDTSGKKNTIQQISSTITYLQRYTLQSICGAATTFDDDGRGAGEPETEKADPFIIKANKAQSVDELTTIWREAMQVINAKDDKAAFDLLHEACGRRKAEIKESAKKVPT